MIFPKIYSIPVRSDNSDRFAFCEKLEYAVLNVHTHTTNTVIFWKHHCQVTGYDGG